MRILDEKAAREKYDIRSDEVFDDIENVTITNQIVGPAAQQVGVGAVLSIEAHDTAADALFELVAPGAIEFRLARIEGVEWETEPVRAVHRDLGFG